jgi:hypothetical protein
MAYCSRSGNRGRLCQPFNLPGSDIYGQLGGLGEVPRALESASARIVLLAIPKLSCAMVPNRTATVAAEISNDEMVVITRPMQAR